MGRREWGCRRRRKRCRLDLFSLYDELHFRTASESGSVDGHADEVFRREEKGRESTVVDPEHVQRFRWPGLRSSAVG